MHHVVTYKQDTAGQLATTAHETGSNMPMQSFARRLLILVAVAALHGCALVGCLGDQNHGTTCNAPI